MCVRWRSSTRTRWKRSRTRWRRRQARPAGIRAATPSADGERPVAVPFSSYRSIPFRYERSLISYERGLRPYELVLIPYKSGLRRYELGLSPYGPGPPRYNGGEERYTPGLSPYRFGPASYEERRRPYQRHWAPYRRAPRPYEYEWAPAPAPKNGEASGGGLHHGAPSRGSAVGLYRFSGPHKRRRRPILAGKCAHGELFGYRRWLKRVTCPGPAPLHVGPTRVPGTRALSGTRAHRMPAVSPSIPCLTLSHSDPWRINPSPNN